MTAEFITHPALRTRHGFFTRNGGVSTGPYASLNANLAGGDAPENVAENRRRVAAAIGVAPEHLLGLKQVHGTRVISVMFPWPAGKGPEADALVCSLPGMALGVITADCAPVLLHDQAAGVIAAVHAGWRGAAAGVLEATLTAMQELGASAARTVAVVGPCIAQASYEVGPDLRAAVAAATPDSDRFFRPGRPPDRLHFDLPGYCLSRLRNAGADAGQALGIDTLTDENRFFSHRRRTLGGGGPIGHQISAITLGQ